MAELSIIIPFFQEYPQVVFTVRAIAEEFLGRADFEILAINNFCDKIKIPRSEEDRGAEALKAAAAINPWLRVLDYSESASHWQAKNLGIKESTGQFLLFTDAHVMPGRDSLYQMFKYYQQNYEEMNGSIHAPLTYKIMEWRKLIYKLKVDLSLGEMEYTFDTFRESDKPYKVPAMSTCGMLIDRKIIEDLGCWPTALGSWGGGENFLNFAMATTGRNIWIWNGEPLYHHGEKRGYLASWGDIVYNRCVAVFIVCGKETAKRYLENVYADRSVENNLLIERILLKIVKKCKEHRELIKAQQIIGLEDWMRNFT